MKRTWLYTVGIIAMCVIFLAGAYFRWRAGHTVAQAEFDGVSIRVIEKPVVGDGFVVEAVPGAAEYGYDIYVYAGSSMISSFHVFWISTIIHSVKIEDAYDPANRGYRVLFDDAYDVTVKFGQDEDLAWAEWKTTHQVHPGK